MAKAAPLTYADYCRLPPDRRWELIEGVPNVVPAPNRRHQDIVVVSDEDMSVVTELNIRGAGVTSRSSTFGIAPGAPKSVVMSPLTRSTIFAVVAGLNAVTTFA
jgi:hypothetical protein